MHLYEPIYPHHHWHVHVDSGLLWRILLLLLILLAAPFLAGCRHDQPAVALAAGATLTLSSTALGDGAVPKEFTCDGQDKSPALSWSAPPAATKSQALLVTDPDAPGGTFTHWVIYNLAPSATSLAPSVPTQPEVEGGARQGRNDFGKVGYNGPCPPPGKPHRYVFTLYALDNALNLQPGATRAQVEAAMQGHVLAQGQITAKYSR